MGATHSYYGPDEFAKFPPGLKSLADAEAIRNRILKAFESAELEEQPVRRRLVVDIREGRGRTDRR